MATQSPFSWAAQAVAGLQPPVWVVDETLNRLVLFLNHVLMSEPEAMQRLARQKGQRIELVWQKMQLQLLATPAGLFERGRFEGFDLRLTVTDESPLDVLAALARGRHRSVIGRHASGLGFGVRAGLHGHPRDLDGAARHFG